MQYRFGAAGGARREQHQTGVFVFPQPVDKLVFSGNARSA